MRRLLLNEIDHKSYHNRTTQVANTVTLIDLKSASLFPAVNVGVKKDNNSREEKSLRAVLNFDPYAVKSEKLNILCRRRRLQDLFLPFFTGDPICFSHIAHSRCALQLFVTSHKVPFIRSL